MGNNIKIKNNTDITPIDIFSGYQPLSFRYKPKQKKGKDGKALPQYQPWTKASTSIKYDSKDIYKIASINK